MLYIFLIDSNDVKLDCGEPPHMQIGSAGKRNNMHVWFFPNTFYTAHNVRGQVSYNSLRS